MKRRKERRGKMKIREERRREMKRRVGNKFQEESGEIKERKIIRIRSTRDKRREEERRWISRSNTF